MNKNGLVSLLCVSVLFGCSSQENACEDITVATEQIQECQALQRRIANAKGQPIIRTELERRYQTDCIDIRFYRDDKQNAICGNKDNVNEIKDAVTKESKQ